MPKNQGYRNNNNAPRRRQAQLDEQNPVVQAFRNYASELDSKHDRHERILKLSRDITIESKRIIFFLHSIDSRKQNKSKVLEEAKQRLTKLIDVNFRAIAQELRNQDVYQFRAAYSPGLQEFIEAYTYMEYLENEDKDRVSDLTGELMRRCINSLGSGDTETCMETCKALQQFYTGYISLNCQRARELWRKITTMRQSMLKTENVCYNVKVRGGEAAKCANFDQKPGDDTDEGFY
ncbi:hypothetical protein ACLKA7_008023 [Drosophila subpalustris]